MSFLDPTPVCGTVIAATKPSRHAVVVDAFAIGFLAWLVVWLFLHRDPPIAVGAGLLLGIASVPLVRRRLLHDALVFDGRTLFVRLPIGRRHHPLTDIIEARAFDETFFGARWTNLKLVFPHPRGTRIFLLEDAHSVAAAIMRAKRSEA